MIFGTDSDPDSAEDTNPNNSANSVAPHQHQTTHNQVNHMMAATTVQLPQQQHSSPQPQILWH